MLADQRQLLIVLGQPAQDGLDEVMRSDRGQVPLQFPQHHQLPLLVEKGEEYKTHRRPGIAGAGSWGPGSFNDAH